MHRGLEKLTEKRDMHQFGYIAERICGICAVGHSYGYAGACERMLDIEVPGRVQYIRTILHELSRIHSHLLWLGLLADAFGFEALFYRSWTLREQILKIFESTCGGRVILSINEIGGLKHDIEDSELAGIVQTLDAMCPDYEALVHTFLDDDSCGERLAWRGRDQQEGCAGAFDGRPVWARLGRGLRRAHVWRRCLCGFGRV